MQHSYRKAGKTIVAGSCQVRGGARCCVLEDVLRSKPHTLNMCEEVPLARHASGKCPCLATSTFCSVFARLHVHICQRTVRRVSITISGFIKLARWSGADVRQPRIYLQRHGRLRSRQLLQVSDQQRRHWMRCTDSLAPIYGSHYPAVIGLLVGGVACMRCCSHIEAAAFGQNADSYFV